MSDLDPLRRAARVARKVPGYPKLRRALVPRLRRNKALRTVAHRIWAVRRTDRRRGAPSSDITAGSLLDGVGTENLPVVGVIALDLTPEQVRELVDVVAEEQLLTAAFRPLFVLDQPAFAATRRYSYVAELVVPADGWEVHGAAGGWGDYLTQRLSSIQDVFGVATWIRVPAKGVDTVLLAQLRALP